MRYFISYIVVAVLVLFCFTVDAAKLRPCQRLEGIWIGKMSLSGNTKSLRLNVVVVQPDVGTKYRISGMGNIGGQKLYILGYCYFFGNIKGEIHYVTMRIGTEEFSVKLNSKIRPTKMIKIQSTQSNDSGWANKM